MKRRVSVIGVGVCILAGALGTLLVSPYPAGARAASATGTGGSVTMQALRVSAVAASQRSALASTLRSNATRGAVTHTSRPRVFRSTHWFLGRARGYGTGYTPSTTTYRARLAYGTYRGSTRYMRSASGAMAAGCPHRAGK